MESYDKCHSCKISKIIGLKIDGTVFINCESCGHSYCNKCIDKLNHIECCNKIRNVRLRNNYYEDTHYDKNDYEYLPSKSSKNIKKNYNVNDKLWRKTPKKISKSKESTETPRSLKHLKKNYKFLEKINHIENNK